MFLEFTIKPPVFHGPSPGYKYVSTLRGADIMAEDLVSGELPGKKYSSIRLLDTTKTKEIKKYDLDNLRAIIKAQKEREMRRKGRMR